MVDNKTVGINAAVAFGMIIAALTIPGFFDEPRYICETKPELVLTCDGFSKYVDPNGKCLNATNLDGIELGNKICRSGWQLIVDDRLPDPKIEDVDIVYEDDLIRQEFVCGKECKVLS